MSKISSRLFLLSLFFFISCSKTTPISQHKKIIYTSKVSKEFLKTLNFNGEELISVTIDGHFYYIREDGRKMRTVVYDNAPDQFVDGLARTRFKGKIGFFNRNLEMVLKPIYDFAFPFHKGIAEICVGCTEGEDSLLEGGEWKKINRKGLVIE